MSYSKQTKPASPGKTNAVKETQALSQLLAIGAVALAIRCYYAAANKVNCPRPSNCLKSASKLTKCSS